MAPTSARIFPPQQDKTATHPLQFLGKEKKHSEQILVTTRARVEVSGTNRATHMRVTFMCTSTNMQKLPECTSVRILRSHLFQTH